MRLLSVLVSVDLEHERLRTLFFWTSEKEQAARGPGKSAKKAVKKRIDVR
jgi:hypothetical protein